jgi:general secretion pathway protein A
MDLAAAAFPPEAKEQIIVVTAEDGLPVMPQSAGLLVAPPTLPAAPVASAAAKASAGSGPAATALPVGEASLGEASVRPGWALSRLAARVYGNGGRPILSALAKANPGVDMTRLRAGESLVYPAIEAKAPPVGSCLVKVAAADSLDQGLAIVARGKERHNLTLALFCTRIPGAGPRFDVVLAALYPDQTRAQAALAALPADLADKAVLLAGFPEGTAYYTDLADWRSGAPSKPRPAIGRQVAESRPVAGQVRPFEGASTAGAEQ